MKAVSFVAPKGIRQSQVAEIIRTVSNRGITKELRRSLERDKRGWKWELAGLLVGKRALDSVRKPRAAEAPAYENKTADISLSFSEQQMITGLLVAGRLEILASEAQKNEDVKKFVEYLHTYSGDPSVRASAGKVLGLLEHGKLEMEERYPGEFSKPVIDDRKRSDENVLVREAVHPTEALKTKKPVVEKNDNDDVPPCWVAAAESFFPKKDGELSASEKQSIASTMRGRDFERVWQKIFGYAKPESIVLGKDKRTDAIVEYIKKIKRESTNAKAQENAKNILANINAL